MSRVFGDTPSRGKKPPRAGDPFGFLDNGKASSDPLQLASLDADTLRDAVANWCDQGYAISFGLTSDGGALGIHLIVGGQKRSIYAATIAEAEDELKRVAGARSA